jgi:hypothetical protein
MPSPTSLRLSRSGGGYLLKHTPAAELVDTLRRIVDGDPCSIPTSRMLLSFHARPRAAATRCLRLRARGRNLKLLATETNRQIARRSS